MSLARAVAKLVEEKVADYGTGVIMQALASTPVGLTLAASSELAQMVKGGVLPTSIPGLGRLNFTATGQELLRRLQIKIQNPKGGGRKARWQRGGWAKSRKDWLSNAWKHDWRSQPRHPAGGAMRWSGTWMDGRNAFPTMNAPRVGKGVQMSSRKKRQRRRYRKYGRLAARSLR